MEQLMQKIEKSATYKSLEDTIRFCWPKNKEVVDISDCGLVYIKSVEEGHSFAGYLVNFMPLAGNYKDTFSDIKVTENGHYGIMSYATMAQILDRAPHTVEAFLKDKESFLRENQ